MTPTVIHVGESSGQGQLQVLDATGSVSRTIDAGSGADELEFSPGLDNSSTSSHREFPVQIIGSTLIALTWVDKPGEPPGKPKAVGVDLNSGARTWTTELPKGAWVLADDPDAREATFIRYPQTEHARVYAADPTNGKLQPGETLARPQGGYLSEYVRFVATEHHLFRVRTNNLAYGPTVVAFR